MTKGTRLDIFLSENKLSASREKAKREIISGWVKVDGETVREPSRKVRGDEDIVVQRPGGLYVSRGGEKLHHALEHFNVAVTNRVAADIGASTGGFTHCLLVHGASVVYAVDVGYGQLDYSLRQNPSVKVMERTHVKTLTRDMFDTFPDLITADLSFISILKTIDALRNVFAPVEVVVLIKPQFEAEPEEHKKGVVKKIEHHTAILRRVIESLCSQGVEFRGLCFSPIKGPAGNIEFLFHGYINESGNAEKYDEDIVQYIDSVVIEAHRVLNE
ncbi:MAG TPA: TlyA family RNA methyltransferase [Spirochaetota bacterium]|nr:TlyA family RNA methyltransferase [Spirochaetota bacterium]HPJ36827.1 TlyA family RNA methyltransferase [Spirochaetota bacterium]